MVSDALAETTAQLAELTREQWQVIGRALEDRANNLREFGAGRGPLMDAEIA
jgi:hypothetical protein